jgi:hypothetical protein
MYNPILRQVYLSIRPVDVNIKAEEFLDRIRDAQIVSLIERIGEHYRTNIANRFLRPGLLQLPLDKMAWDQIEILTEKMEQYRYQGFHFDELYRQIASAARFVGTARHETVVSLRNRLGGDPGGSDRVLRDMAINNFASNLKLFADLVNELYTCLIKLDNEAAVKGRKPVYLQMPELTDINHQLMGT